MSYLRRLELAGVRQSTRGFTVRVFQPLGQQLQRYCACPIHGKKGRAGVVIRSRLDLCKADLHDYV